MSFEIFDTTVLRSTLYGFKGKGLNQKRDASMPSYGSRCSVREPRSTVTLPCLANPWSTPPRDPIRCIARPATFPWEHDRDCETPSGAKKKPVLLVNPEKYRRGERTHQCRTLLLAIPTATSTCCYKTQMFDLKVAVEVSTAARSRTNTVSGSVS